MQNKHKGFTLIELMVTIAVMAIIAMMAAPSFGDMLQRQNLNKSTKELVATLNQARAKAALERREITVELLSADENTDDTLNWMPVGKSSLKTGRATEIVFMPTGW
jgi:type IV fimbrial biogenesis protein FimT